MPSGQAREPARARAPAVPAPPLGPREGRWLWTCRAGFEPHLFEELAWAGGQPRLLGAGLLESAPSAVRPAFARTGFPVERVLEGDAASVEAQAKEWIAVLGRSPLHLQPWAPDVDGAQDLHAIARAAGERLARELPQALQVADPEATLERGGWFVQLCWLTPTRVAVGAVRAREAFSLWPGGRRRMRRPSEAPSRAAMKLEEALDTLGVEPGPGELCVDLGAAPGGWTQRLLARRARVVAVDPARLSHDLERNRLLTHVKASAFDFEPDEPADWLFCDMAWRPLEVAELLAKWARRGWALHLVANIKLPMRDKNPVLLRVRRTLEGGGWKGLAIRQLYHDRDEVTVTARRL